MTKDSKTAPSRGKKKRQPELKLPKINADRERAVEVLEVLYEDYMARRRLFQHIGRVDAPQRRYVPDGMTPGSQEHALWLFFAVMTDRREVSDNVYTSHVRLWKQESWLYTPEVVGRDPQEILRAIKTVKIGLPTQAARIWPICAKTLFGTFDGNPLRLYEGGSIDAILSDKEAKRVDLPGFGPKILSLLSVFYDELGLLTIPEDAFPVDLHVQRFAISTGIIRSNGKVLTAPLEKVLRPLLCGIIREKGWSTLELAHAVWFLGNRLCTSCPGSQLPEHHCPAYGLCGGPIPSASYSKKGLWDFGLPRLPKGRTSSLPLHELPLFGAKAADTP